MAPVFVTGASGFIGGALAERLLEQGHEVIGLARSDTAEAKVRAHGATPARGNVLDEDSLARAMERCELVYHVAGLNTHCPHDPSMQMRVNVDGAAATIRAASRAGVRRVVYTSSAASVGEPKGTVGDEETVHRGSYLSVYDRSKHLGEQVVFSEARRLGVEAVAVNPSSVQGPGRYEGNGKLIVSYLNGKLRVFLDTYVSVVDIADTVEGHVLAAGRGKPGGRYVLNGATVPAREALRIVSEIAGVQHPVRMVPPALAHAVAAAGEAAARARGRTFSLCRGRVNTFVHGHRYDGSRATRELGLRYTPLEETFRRTLDWARAEGLLTAR
jgi:dihydroflavonol-4-reductase